MIKRDPIVSNDRQTGKKLMDLIVVAEAFGLLICTLANQSEWNRKINSTKGRWICYLYGIEFHMGFQVVYMKYEHCF